MAFTLDIVTVLSFIYLVNLLVPGLSVLNKWQSKILFAEVYFVSFTIIFNQTLGKIVMGIKVNTITGGSPRWEDILIREVIGKLASACIMLTGFLMVAFEPRKRALHDYFTNMVVAWETEDNAFDPLLSTKTVHKPLP